MTPFLGKNGTIQHMYHFNSIEARVHRFKIEKITSCRGQINSTELYMVFASTDADGLLNAIFSSRRIICKRERVLLLKNHDERIPSNKSQSLLQCQHSKSLSPGTVTSLYVRNRQAQPFTADRIEKSAIRAESRRPFLERLAFCHYRLSRMASSIQG